VRDPLAARTRQAATKRDTDLAHYGANGAKIVQVDGVTHFEMYIAEAFERSSNAAAGWYRKYLGLE